MPPEYYDLLPEPEVSDSSLYVAICAYRRGFPGFQDDENDMLDMAFGLTDTSRLGCQVVLTRDLDGMTITLPSATRNMFVDGKSLEQLSQMTKPAALSMLALGTTAGKFSLYHTVTLALMLFLQGRNPHIIKSSSNLYPHIMIASIWNHTPALISPSWGAKSKRPLFGVSSREVPVCAQRAMAEYQ